MFALRRCARFSSKQGSARRRCERRSTPGGPDSARGSCVGGLWVAADGELTCDHVDELRGSAYRCGQVYGFHVAVAGATFYHHGSADLRDDKVTHRGVDFLLAGIAGRGFTRDDTGRILGRLEHRFVITQHFDDFAVCALDPMQRWSR